MAFGVDGYLDGELKDDPRYVKYFVRVVGKSEGKEYDKVLPYHRCTDKDWVKFSPISSKSKESMQVRKTDPKKGLFCIDWTDDLFVSGEENNLEYQRLEFLMTPCNYIHQKWGYTEDSVSDECIADAQQQQAYLGPLDFQLYFNNESFDQQSFGDESIERKSELIHFQFNADTPVWFNYMVQTNMVSDETQLFQLGESEDREFHSYVDNIKSMYSAWQDFPTEENPYTLYKYASMEINLFKDMRQINRQTYSLLDWLGDCGGLLDALFFIGEIFVNPISLYFARSRIASLLVSMMPTNHTEEKVVGDKAKREQFIKKFGENIKDPKRKELVSNIAREMSSIEKIEEKGYMASIVERCKKSRYHRLLRKS